MLIILFILVFLDLDEEFILEVDVSVYGLGGVIF